MCRIFHILLIIGVNIIFSQCYIPHLSVKRLDGNVVLRKRQDTLDMCRIFNAEYAAGNVFNNVNDKIYIRNKRAVNVVTDKYLKQVHRNPNHKQVIRFDSKDIENDPDDNLFSADISDENSKELDDNVKMKMKQHLATNNVNIDNIDNIVNNDNNSNNVNNGNIDNNDRIVDPDPDHILSTILDSGVGGQDNHSHGGSIENNGNIASKENGESVGTLANVDTYSTQSTLFGINGWSTDFAPKQLMGPNDKDDVTVKPPDDEPTEPVKWHKKWKHGIVPFYIDPKTYDTLLGASIINAFDYFEKATCIRLQRLRERPTDQASLKDVEWIYITNPTGIRQCVHSNEQKENSGVQMVVFGYDCMSLGEIIHELMHVLGFSHEHVRRDRDKYVQIMWDNIKPGYKKYFMVRNEETLLHIPYDYTSVMHYPPRAFSKNGQMTIMTEGKKIGQREGLSELDAEKVNYVYAYECLERNKLYLLQTCPTVVSHKNRKYHKKNVTNDEIDEYFQDRIWNFGIINYKFHDSLQFTIEERQNIMAVIEHIEKETCLQFRNAAKQNDASLEAPLDYYQDDNSTTNTNDGNDYHTKKINDVSSEETQPYTATNLTSDDLKDAPLAGDRRRNVYTPKPSVRTKHRLYSRRHAQEVLILARVEETGCKCPKPGKPSGNQLLQISTDCFQSVNDLLHLFVHVLGLDHQHNMYDRDSYLHILWDNLTPEVKNELKEKLPPAASLGFPYDYQSVMHYPWLQIKNGVTNIMYPIWNDGWAMGHWQGLSSTDVQKIKLLYGDKCAERKKQEKSK